MTDEDKTLLEMAAKAVGITLMPMEVLNVEHPGDDRFIGYMADPDQCPRGWFNPLGDDGDALRLAVKLQLGISIPPVPDGRVDVVTFYGPIISIVEYPLNDDRQTATRLAIVRAAAEIGKAMK